MAAPVIIRSGNLLQDPSRLQRDSANEVVVSIESVARQHADVTKTPAQGPVVLADKEFVAMEKPERAPEHQALVNVKLFLNDHVNLAALNSALEFCWTTLQLEKVDTFLLSLPLDDDLANGDETLPPQFLTAALPLWKTLEQHVHAGRIHKLGACCMNRAQLEQFFNAVEIKPSIDQVNLENCCTLPKDLIAFSRDHHVELLTHNDRPVILATNTLRQVLMNAPANSYLAQIAPTASVGWVLRFTAMVPQRGVTTNKSYAIGVVLD